MGVRDSDKPEAAYRRLSAHSNNSNPFAAVSDRSQSKVPLFVLAVGAVLLCAGALLSVLITVPGLGSRTPPAVTAENGKTARPQRSPASPAPAQAEAQSEPMPAKEDKAAPGDPPVTGALAEAPPSAETPAAGATEGSSTPPGKPDPVMSETTPATDPTTEPDSGPASIAAADPTSEPEPDADIGSPASAPNAPAEIATESGPTSDTERPAQVETETQEAPDPISDGPTAIAEASPHATEIEAPARDHIESHAQDSADAETAKGSEPDRDSESTESARAATAAPEPSPEPSSSDTADKIAKDSKPDTSPTETATVEAAAPEPSSNVAAETAETSKPDRATASPNEMKTAGTDAPASASETATSTEAVAKEPEEQQPTKSAPPPPAPVRRAEEKPEPAPIRRADKPTPAVTSQAQSKPGMRPMALGFGGGLFKPPAKSAPKARAPSPGAYGAAVRAAIGRHKPRAAGARGKATVTFSIGALGGLRSVGVSRSSGNKQLDQAAIASVRRAAPFPSPPAGSNPTYSLQIYFH